MRILTGMQSTNLPHLGNILGAMLPALQLAKTSKNASLFFIANLHALTTQPKTTSHQYFIQAQAAAWLACGLDPKKDILYRQSHLPQVCELAWYLNCLTPYATLTKAHAFKDKAENLTNINVGLFTYPVLMAADILLYKATHVPVGTDQLQHIEIARDLAKRFNHLYAHLFTLPQAHLQQAIPTVPGTDGKKMSKSYHNTISPFWSEKLLYKTIMAIPTDSTPLAAPKNPTTCKLFSLFSSLASQEDVEYMRKKYLAGGYGYGSAKKVLFSLIMERFADQRAEFERYMRSRQELEAILVAGEVKACTIANTTLKTLRSALGYA